MNKVTAESEMLNKEQLEKLYMNTVHFKSPVILDGLQVSNHRWSAGGGHQITVSDGIHTNTASGKSLDDALTKAQQAVEFRRDHPDGHGHIVMR